MVQRTQFRWYCWIWLHAANVPLMYLCKSKIIAIYSYTTSGRSWLVNWHRFAWSKESRFILQHSYECVKVRSLSAPFIQQVIYCPLVVTLFFRNILLGICDCGTKDHESHMDAECLNITAENLYLYIVSVFPNRVSMVPGI